MEGGRRVEEVIKEGGRSKRGGMLEEGRRSIEKERERRKEED